MTGMGYAAAGTFWTAMGGLGSMSAAVSAVVIAFTLTRRQTDLTERAAQNARVSADAAVTATRVARDSLDVSAAQLDVIRDQLRAAQEALQVSAEAHQHLLDSQVVERERAEAEAAMRVLDQYNDRFLREPFAPDRWQEPIAMWNNELIVHTNRVRDVEIQERLKTLGTVQSYMTFWAISGGSGVSPHPAMHAALFDLHRALRGLTLNREPYPREMPPASEVESMLVVDGQLDFGRLILREVPPGDDWLRTPRRTTT
jgi:hypothetical protein